VHHAAAARRVSSMGGDSTIPWLTPPWGKRGRAPRGGAEAERRARLAYAPHSRRVAGRLRADEYRRWRAGNLGRIGGFKSLWGTRPTNKKKRGPMGASHPLRGIEDPGSQWGLWRLQRQRLSLFASNRSTLGRPKTGGPGRINQLSCPTPPGPSQVMHILVHTCISNHPWLPSGPRLSHDLLSPLNTLRDMYSPPPHPFRNRRRGSRSCGKRGK
jgi:hypothetical protein